MLVEKKKEMTKSVVIDLVPFLKREPFVTSQEAPLSQ